MTIIGIFRGAILSPYSCKSEQTHCSAETLFRSIPHRSARIYVARRAISNDHKENPDFSRQQKGSSRGRGRGRSKQFQELEQSESSEETYILSSRNGSLTSNTRHQATATPGQRDEEILELFRKIQMQLQAAAKKGKKSEASRQRQNDRATVDSLVKLLRKHSMDQKSSPKEHLSTNLLARSKTLADEQKSNLFGPDGIKLKEEPALDPGLPDPVSSTRPATNFRRKSLVRRTNFKAGSFEEGINPPPANSQASRKKKSDIIVDKSEASVHPDIGVLDSLGQSLLDDQFDPSPSNETAEVLTESSTLNISSDLASLKLSELRNLAKSRGLRGYSKLKKGELVELLDDQHQW
ncbi:SAP-like protein BP-73 [Curcuma longa]|uniref:SAP-like protein BP-73 n=1 Tax=Curcuma longa TaxID=136217 RepID=UPI003D9E89A2